MLPRDVHGLTVPRDAVTISGWAPFVELKIVPDESRPDAAEHDQRCHNSPLERGAAAIARAGSALRRAA
jgi:hypothetical protein